MFSSERSARYSPFLFDESWKQNLFSSLLFEHSGSHQWLKCCVRKCVGQEKIAIVEGGDVCFITGTSGRQLLCKGCLNVAHIILLGWILCMLSSDFKAQGVRSILTPPMTALTEFFHANAETNAPPLPVSWYFISCSLYMFRKVIKYYIQRWVTNSIFWQVIWNIHCIYW